MTNTRAQPARGMLAVGTFTLAVIDPNGAQPTAIIYSQSEDCNAVQALRDFCTAYGTAKGAVAIVLAHGKEMSGAAAVTATATPDDAPCGRVGCVLPKGHKPETHRDVSGARIATQAELEAE